MKNIILLLIVFLVFVFCCLSCNKYPCNDTGLSVRFSGYDSGSIAKVVIARYGKGSNFSTLIYTEVADSANRKLLGDAHYYLSYDFNYNFDYIIQVNDTGKKYQLSNINMSNTSQTLGWGRIRDYCYDVVTSYELDGVEYNTGKTGGTFIEQQNVNVELKK